MSKVEKDFIEEMAEAPAIILEKTLKTTGEAIASLPGKTSLKKARRYWDTLGPGLTTGASDDDPSGIATYSQTGAQYGFQLLWLAPFTFPLMATIQEMCARIGMQTGNGLASNIRQNFSKKILYGTAGLLLAANAFNIGADLGAMAQGVRLLIPSMNAGLLVIFFTLLSIGLQIFVSYARYAQYLKYLALVLLAYIVSAILAGLDWRQVAHAAVVPSITFSKDQVILICAILGTTISPYLFFWQSSQEVEEEISKGKTSPQSRKGMAKKEIREMRVDVWSGMFLSNAVMFFIIAACAAVLYSRGITTITSAAEAAEALRPFAGDSTYFLFALGIIGTGLLAIPVLAGSAAYVIAESFDWKTGLSKTLKQARAFYGVIIIAMCAGLAMNFVGLDPIKALIYSAVLNGLIAPVILVLIVRLSSSKLVMGKRTNGPLTTAVGWFTVTLMVFVGLATISALFV
ncbi:MAG: Nramp family divalent metal transporter [Candidatus Moranbacteria bacterium]|nr:Nramp family divalent metal transporter [Candidatus Moranbacteria bacterium]